MALALPKEKTLAVGAICCPNCGSSMELSAQIKVDLASQIVGLLERAPNAMRLGDIAALFPRYSYLYVRQTVWRMHDAGLILKADKKGYWTNIPKETK